MIEIFDNNGEPQEYIPVAERMPAFLAKYGPDKGYSLLTDVKGFLDIHLDLKPAHLAAIEAGHNPSDVGLPPIDSTLFRFEARLVDAEGNVLAEASALRRINTNIDNALDAKLWEAAETAATQRLLARTGFGSDTLLTDELTDMTQHGLSFAPKGEGESAPTTGNATSDTDAQAPAEPEKTQRKPRTRSKQAEGPSKSVEPEEAAAPAQVAESEHAATETKPAQPAKQEAAAKPSNGAAPSEVSEALLRQIRHLASVRGIEPPVVTTKAQAKEALKSLRGTPAATT